MSQNPDHLKYTKDHEWADKKGGVVTIGITHHAQSALGDIVFVELPKVGRELKAGETFGVVESIKAVSDLFSPIAGKVIEVNSALTEQPQAANHDPYGSGWMIKLESAQDLSSLMDVSAYSKYVESL